MSLALVGPDSFDHDAERAVLAAVLISHGEALAACDTVGVSWRDFADARHQVLYAAMQQLQRIGRGVDPITLGAYLEARGALAKAGGREYFGGLFDEVPTADRVRYHADLVLRAARRRGGRDDGVQRDEQAAQVDEAQRFLDLEADAFFRFPWPKLDALVGGLAPGTLSFLAGHPGGGKTSWLLTLITRCVAAGQRITYAGLETRPNKLRAQVAARVLGIDPGPIFAGVTQRDPHWPDIRARLKAEVERQRTDARWTEHLRFCPQAHVDVKAAVEIMAEAKDFGSDLVVIDHIDHVTAEARNGIAEAHAIVTVFDTATKRHDLVTLAATQTNNEGDATDPFLTHRPLAPKQIWMGKRKEQVGEMFLSVYRPMRADPPVTPQDRLDVREGKQPIGPLLAQCTTRVGVLKARALGESRGAFVDLGFWRGEVLDEIPHHRVLPFRQGAA